MSPTEYNKVLDQIAVESTKWEAALKKADPAKSNVSYAVGKQIVEWRELGLKEVAWARQTAAKERAKHTVSGELALEGFVEGVFNMMDNMVQTEIAAGITISDLEKYAPDIGSLRIRIANDVTTKVELLEKGTCPSVQ